MKFKKYLVAGCGESLGGAVIECLPSTIQVGDSYTKTRYPILYPEGDDPFWETWDNDINSIPSSQITSPPRFAYAVSDTACENSMFVQGQFQQMQIFSQPTEFQVNNMMPCPGCCNKPDKKPWDLYDSLPSGELQPNFPGTKVVGGVTFTISTDQDYENAGCVRRCDDRAVIDSPGPLTPQGHSIPGKEGGEEIQQIDKSLQESIIKRLQKLAGIKKSKK